MTSAKYLFRNKKRSFWDRLEAAGLISQNALTIWRLLAAVTSPFKHLTFSKFLLFFKSVWLLPNMNFLFNTAMEDSSKFYLSE